MATKGTRNAKADTAANGARGGNTQRRSEQALLSHTEPAVDDVVQEKQGNVTNVPNRPPPERWLENWEQVRKDGKDVWMVAWVRTTWDACSTWYDWNENDHRDLQQSWVYVLREYRKRAREYA